MLLLGDVLGFLTALVGICFSTWAVTVGFTALFPRRSDIAHTHLVLHPVKSILSGLVVWLVLGSVALGIMNLPNPLLKLAGMLLLMALIGFTAVGASGLAKLLAERFQQLEPEMSDFASLSRGALVLVVAGILPLVGWFAVIPLVLAAGLGAGMKAVFSKIENPLPQFEIRS